MLFLQFLQCLLLCLGVHSQTMSIPLRRATSAMETLLALEADVDHRMWLQFLKPKPARKNDTIALRKYLDSEFYGEVSIGRPAQTFQVFFDTTWGYSYVPSSECSVFSVPCMNKDKYSAGKSSTYIENGKPFEVDFGGGSKLSGHLSTDNVHIGHSTVANMTFAEVSTLPWSEVFSKVDGVFGLGYSKLTTDDMPPFFYLMLKQKLIEKPIFSFYMNRDRTTDRAGNLILGGSDPTHYFGNLTYTSVIEKMYWKFTMDRIAMGVVGKNTTIPFCSGSCPVILDTSTTIITGPLLEINKINKLLGAMLIWKVGRSRISCNRINKLPDITFFISGKNFTLKGRDYVQQMTTAGIQVCLSAFVAVDLPKPNDSLWALGAAFMGKFYTEFDMGLNRIGFAESR